MQMQYEVGQFLGERYNGSLFQNSTFTREEVYFRSTDVDRCLMSAASNLAGLFPPSESEKFNPNIAWQPLPIHTEPKEEDYLLRTSGTKCPYYDELYQKELEGEYANQLNEQNKDFFKFLKNRTGILTDITIDNVFTIEDPLFCEQAHNLILPDWVTDEVMFRLENLTNIGMTMLFAKPELARLKGGPLVGKMIKDMETKCENVTGNPMKFYMYSAHDTTLAAFMSALGVYNKKQSPYASVVGVELWEDRGNFSVSMWFRNATDQKKPYALKLADCGEMCPLPKFKELLKNVVPLDVKAECGATFEKNCTIAIVIGTSIIVLTLLLIFLYLICRGRHLTQKDGHVRLPQTPDV
ncbi:lysosomal acid phosphatase-like isoform X2 [Diadema setosum]